MRSRWSILTVLFLVRATMAFQFQAVAALSPLVMAEFGVGLSEIGLLIGLYLAPGIAMAYPGGTIGRILGDRRAVAAGMLLMIAGGTLMALGTGWEAQLAGRIVAGTGGVVLNVIMSKMVQDWFAGREIATAMAIFVNSWPVGIAAALLVLPPVAAAGGLATAGWFVVGLVALGLVLLLTGYHAPVSAATRVGQRERISPAAMRGVLLAGSIWGLYNAALAMVFGFGTALLVERGRSMVEASAATSLALWIMAISVPLGGILADRSGRRDATLVAGLVATAVALTAVAAGASGLAAFAVLGIVGGIAAGPIMSLPAAILAPATRAQGMGIFYTCQYICAVLGPAAAGAVAERAGSASAAFLFGAGLLAACLPLLALFRAATRAGAEKVA